MSEINYIFSGQLRRDNQTILAGLNVLIHQGEKLMAQIDDLNTAVAELTAKVSAIAADGAKVDADVTALLATIAANPTQPAVDLTAAIQAIQAQTASLASVDTGLVAADASANPAPPTAPAA